MRWRTSLAVAALTCQIGVRISSTSAVLTSETGRRPMRGNTYRSMLRHQLLRVPPPAPAAALLFEHALCDLGEAGNALGAALLGKWVAA